MAELSVASDYGQTWNCVTTAVRQPASGCGLCLHSQNTGTQGLMGRLHRLSIKRKEQKTLMVYLGICEIYD